MEDINADTEWNDILHKMGIIKRDENNQLSMDEKGLNDVMDLAINKMTGIQANKMDDVAKFNEANDDEEEKYLNELRQKRMMELKEQQLKPRFGSIIEIGAQDYVEQVTTASNFSKVVLFLYEPTNLLCKSIDNALAELASTFIHIKFLRSRASKCISNYPEKNVPTIFVYENQNITRQLIGQESFNSKNNHISFEDLKSLIGLSTGSTNKKSFDVDRNGIMYRKKQNSDSDSE